MMVKEVVLTEAPGFRLRSSAPISQLFDRVWASMSIVKELDSVVPFSKASEPSFR
jgi:hypothetical protein